MDGDEEVIRKSLHTVGTEEASSLPAVRCCDELKRIRLHVRAAGVRNVTFFCFRKKFVHKHLLLNYLELSENQRLQLQIISPFYRE